MLALEVHTHKIPDIFHRFASQIGEAHWRKRVQQCLQAIKGNELLREFMMRENDIAFQLNHLSHIWHRYGGLPRAEVENHAIYPAMSFATQVLSIMDGSSRANAERFRRRVHGALKNPADMRGLRLELSAATHFSRRGRKISWPETTGIGTFDILVEKEDSLDPLEVECKSIGDDKGRRIRQQEVIEFAALLKPHIGSTTAGLRQGLSVILTVPDRLPSAYKDRVELAKALGRAVFGGTEGQIANGATVRMTDFDVSQIGDPRHMHPAELRKAVDSVSGTENRSALIIGTPAGGVLSLTIQSQRDDVLLSAVFDTLSDAAKRQLTGTRAGMLYTEFGGLDGDQLRSIADQDQNPSQHPTALRIGVSQFLSSTSRDHIIGVGFVSRSALAPADEHLVESGGIAYYFPKRESSFWAEGFSGLFEWSPS